jgi:membrane protease subunit (stomatin/prohibitin family)
MVQAQADAMKTAAGNAAGAMTGFMGFGMAQNAGGIQATELYRMGQAQQPASPAPAAPESGWVCACGTRSTGKFCPECGAQKPEEGWQCSCGSVNKGKFCPECGSPKPVAAPNYRCNKCGWEPADPKNPPKFCPECGDRFDVNDRT